MLGLGKNPHCQAMSPAVRCSEMDADECKLIMSVINHECKLIISANQSDKGDGG